MKSANTNTNSARLSTASQTLFIEDEKMEEEPKFLMQKVLQPEFTETQQAVQGEYFKMDPRYFQYTANDQFQLDKIDGLYSIDHCDIFKLKVVFTWIGFPGWESVYSLDQLNKQKLLNVRMLHRIRLAIEDRTKPYVCSAIYRGFDFKCPGPQFCEYYHIEDIQNQLYLLEKEICHKLNYQLLFNPMMQDMCQQYFTIYSNQLNGLYQKHSQEHKHHFALSFYSKFSRQYVKHQRDFKQMQTHVNDTEGQILKYIDEAVIKRQVIDQGFLDQLIEQIEQN